MDDCRRDAYCRCLGCRLIGDDCETCGGNPSTCDCNGLYSDSEVEGWNRNELRDCPVCGRHTLKISIRADICDKCGYSQGY